MVGDLSDLEFKSMLRKLLSVITVLVLFGATSSAYAVGNKQGRLKLPDHIDQVSLSEALVLERDLYRGIHDGSISVRTYMRGLSQFSRARDLRVAAAPIEQFAHIHDTIVESYARPNVRDRFIELYGGRIGDLRRRAETQNDPESTAAVQLLAFLALKAEHPAIREDEMALADQILIEQPGHRSTLTPVQEARYALALSVAVKHDGETYVPLLFEKLERAENPKRRSQILSATSWVSDPEVYRTVLERLVDESLSPDEARQLLAALFANANNRWAGWRWLKENYDATREALDVSDNEIAGVLGSFCTRKAHRDIGNFYRSKSFGVTEFPNGVTQALNQIDRCISFRQKKGNEITSYMAGP